MALFTPIVRPRPSLLVSVAQTIRLYYRRGSAFLRGNQGASRVRALIAEASVCADCLAWRIGIRPADVYQRLHRLAAAHEAFRSDIGRCQRCLRDKVVHRMG